MRMVKTPESPSPSLGDLIGHVLDELQITKAKLAGLVGMNPSQLSRWTTGHTKPSYESVLRLGEALAEHYPHLGIGPAELLAAAGYSSDTAAHGPPSEASTVRAKARVPAPETLQVADTLKELLEAVGIRMVAIETQLSDVRNEVARLREENASLRAELEDIRRRSGREHPKSA